MLSMDIYEGLVDGPMACCRSAMLAFTFDTINKFSIMQDYNLIPFILHQMVWQPI
jgi:hypothetical protein